MSVLKPFDHTHELAADIGLPRRLLDDLGAIPSYYLHHFYAERAVVDQQRHEQPRAAVVAEIERALLQLYRDPALDTKPPLLEQRGGSFYSEAATQLLAALFADDVVELPARVGRTGAVPLAQLPLAPELLGLVQHVAAYERLAARAAAAGDDRLARLALMTNPLVREYALAGELLGQLR